MGLLVSDSHPERLTGVILKSHNFLCIVCYLVGIAWFTSLAWNGNNAGIYFSENALLPGLVENEFNLDADVRGHLRDLKDEMETHMSDVPTAWLLLQFRKLGLEAQVHNFTLHYPLGTRSSFEGHNVFAVMRAPRAAGTEALVFSVPFRPPTSVHDGTAASVALMLALAKHFRRHTFWSRDIIFLITEHEQLGAHAWLDAYYGTKGTNEVLDSGRLISRGGKILAAINLELEAEYVSRIDVKFEGLTGQLPNLDLLNLVFRLCAREGVKVTLKNYENHLRPHQWEGWLHQLRTMVAMMKTQATGIPSGNHGLFLRYNVEAVTLKGYAGTKSRGVSTIRVGRVLEGVFRSLNNLLESFHQSFFFYLLPSTDRYVSIGLYMPPFGLILLPVLLGVSPGKAIKLRIRMVKTTLTQDGTKTETSSSVSTVTHSIISTVPELIVSHSIGIACALSPPYFDTLGMHLAPGIGSGESILVGMVAVFLAVLTLPVFMSRKSITQSSSWESLKCVSLLETALLSATISLVNFSLAFITTVFFVPVLVIISPSSSRIVVFLKSILLILCSPICLGFFALLYDTWLTHPDLRIDSLLVQTYAVAKRSMLFVTTDYYIYHNWLFPIICIFFYSNWVLFWLTLHKKCSTTN